MVARASPTCIMQPTIIILPNLGSTGSLANILPSGVSSSALSKHFISETSDRAIFLEFLARVFFNFPMPHTLENIEGELTDVTG